MTDDEDDEDFLTWTHQLNPNQYPPEHVFKTLAEVSKNPYNREIKNKLNAMYKDIFRKEVPKKHRKNLPWIFKKISETNATKLKRFKVYRGLDSRQCKLVCLLVRKTKNKRSTMKNKKRILRLNLRQVQMVQLQMIQVLTKVRMKLFKLQTKVQTRLQIITTSNNNNNGSFVNNNLKSVQEPKKAVLLQVHTTKKWNFQVVKTTKLKSYEDNLKCQQISATNLTNILNIWKIYWR